MTHTIKRTLKIFPKKFHLENRNTSYRILVPVETQPNSKLGIMDRFVGKVAIVTGSSSGIGAAISKELVKKGVIVAGLARRMDKLENLAEELADSTQYAGKFHAVQCDITKEEEIEASLQWISIELGPISILVNNAGIMECGFLTEVTSEQFYKSYDTNVKAVLLLSKEVTKNMIENSIDGHIININSMCGHTIIHMEPNVYLLYTSTKQALRVISEGLRREMGDKKVNIKVTNLSPGIVKTEMTADLNDLPSLNPEDIAKSCIAVLDTPPHVNVSEMTVLPLHQKM